ncbi:inter-alpha-trypsin inhibitor heavy chain H6-like isoform X3 [Panulirus ornatus]|uniref:inter-alpha-trypsin inhibitor heavy chain H6-like isoform X3 n=1 Tax=Panulirus ornatus TaxID=150431 RepID=UPI003A876413
MAADLQNQETSCGSPSQVSPDPVESWTERDLQIISYHIQSVVISRYAVTTVTCKIRNPSLDAQEAVFSIMLPANAFISNLTIEAGGRNYSSLVREKEEARRIYDKAKTRGRNTAIVHQRERETMRFRVDVTVSEQDEVIFYLTYEELLIRRLGVYAHKINIHPGYPVKDLLVDVTIHETRDISILRVDKVPGGKDFRNAVTEWREGGRTARLQFDPDPGMIPDNKVIHGQLVVHYDVERALDAGDVQIEEGYFVHFFAPIDLQYTPKHITFLIDTSGSMEGIKLMQVKEALHHILTDLNAGDTFNIIRFSSSTHKLGMMHYTKSSVRKAKKYIDNLEADGATDIDSGLKMALSRRRLPPRIHFPHHNYLQACTVKGRSIGRKPNLSLLPVAIEEEMEVVVPESVRPHIIVLLTDGQPTVGVTSHSAILKNVRERNKEGATIFCLGFGTGADMKLLERISLQNHGGARKIYEDADAAEQLKNFYQELSTPILLDVQFSYSGDAVQMDSLSNTHFYNYFKGTELVVTGQTGPDLVGGIRANITGQGRNGEFFMGVTDWNSVVPPDHHLLDHLHLAPTPRNFIRRLWAFLKVKDLLEKEKAAKGLHEKAVARKKALLIALENHFVTPLTSLVVVQPDQENCKDYEDDEDESEDVEIDLQKDKMVDFKDVNDSMSVSLRSQDSVIRVFDPAKIKLLRDEPQDYDYLDGEAYSPSHVAHGFFNDATLKKPSEALFLITFLMFMNAVLSQIKGPQIHLPVK